MSVCKEMRYEAIGIVTPDDVYRIPKVILCTRR